MRLMVVIKDNKILNNYKRIARLNSLAIFYCIFARQTKINLVMGTFIIYIIGLALTLLITYIVISWFNGWDNE